MELSKPVNNTSNSLSKILEGFTSPCEILNYFAENYCLRYKIGSGILGENLTGMKDNYYSINKKAESIGYVPRHSAKDCIIDEAKEILKNIY